MTQQPPSVPPEAPSELTRPGAVSRVLARLSGLFLDPSAAAGGLGEVERLAADYRDLSQQLAAALRTSYFQPGKVSATVPGDPTSRMPQQ